MKPTNKLWSKKITVSQVVHSVPNSAKGVYAEMYR